MRCVAISGGAVVDIDPQPVDYSQCVYVLASPGEVGGSPFVLDEVAAAGIGGAILLLWASAFGIRLLRRALL